MECARVHFNDVTDPVQHYVSSMGCALQAYGWPRRNNKGTHASTRYIFSYNVPRGQGTLAGSDQNLERVSDDGMAVELNIVVYIQYVIL